MVSLPWYLLAVGILLVVIGFLLAGLPGSPGREQRSIHHKMKDDDIIRELKRSQRVPVSGLVILADTFYPGWRLAIDGVPAPILQANHLMRGAAVKSGVHRLVYTYEPDSFRDGLRLTIAGAVALPGLNAAIGDSSIRSASS